MLTQVSSFLFSVGKLFFDSILSDWGIIGLGLIATFLVIRVVKFIKRFFK